MIRRTKIWLTHMESKRMRKIFFLLILVISLCGSSCSKSVAFTVYNQTDFPIQLLWQSGPGPEFLFACEVFPGKVSGKVYAARSGTLLVVDCKECVTNAFNLIAMLKACRSERLDPDSKVSSPIRTSYNRTGKLCLLKESSTVVREFTPTRMTGDMIAKEMQKGENWY